MSYFEEDEQHAVSAGYDTCQPPGLASDESSTLKRRMITRRSLLLAPYSIMLGFGGGYLGLLLWKQSGAPHTKSAAPVASVPDLLTTAQVETLQSSAGQSPTPALPTSFDLHVSFGDIGPRLIEAGAIDLPRFTQVNTESDRPLSDEQRAILTTGSGALVTIDLDNSYFLLNFLWAFGLTNQNPLLTEGDMIRESGGSVTNFASTGGWTLATKPIAELYASVPLVVLTRAQQALVERVAASIFRPCCNNSTAFPDCNHGMAMLGLMELMAAQGANEAGMLEAAKFVNAFWFPDQMADIAALVEITEASTYADSDSGRIVSANYSSYSGAQAVHNWLANSGNLPKPNQRRNSCGV